MVLDDPDEGRRPGAAARHREGEARRRGRIRHAFAHDLVQRAAFEAARQQPVERQAAVAQADRRGSVAPPARARSAALDTGDGVAQRGDVGWMVMRHRSPSSTRQRDSPVVPSGSRKG